MGMNNSESKYYNTAVRMDIALLELLGSRDYASITVKEICRQAGVNRSTFYLHYETISDLLEEALEYARSNFIESFQLAGAYGEIPDDITLMKELDAALGMQLVNSYLRFVQSNQAVVLAAYNNPSLMQMDVWMDFISSYALDPILEKSQIPNNEMIYWRSYYRQGTQAIVRTWMQEGCTTPVEDMGRIIMQCIKSERKFLV